MAEQNRGQAPYSPSAASDMEWEESVGTVRHLYESGSELNDSNSDESPLSVRDEQRGRHESDTEESERGQVEGGGDGKGGC
jgi:hypothetical protein